MEIWINPACSKCRTATKALDEADDHTTAIARDPQTLSRFLPK